MLNAAEELYFWSGIMRDHTEFIITSMSYREMESIRTANQLKSEFITIHNNAEAMIGKPVPFSSDSLVNRSISVLLSFICFKRQILRRLLSCDIETSLTPSFVNLMINEALEFYRELCRLKGNYFAKGVLEEVRLHIVWLTDASGHAAILASDLDETEEELIKEARKFKETFDGLRLKSEALEKMLARTGLDDGALGLLTKQVEEKISEFVCYLAKIRALREKCMALGAFKPLVPDHMIREEEYYLTRIRAYRQMQGI